MLFQFSKDLYSKSSVLKAAYHYTDKAFVHLDARDGYYIVNLEMKQSDDDRIEEKEFQNELLAQEVRLDVRNKTKNIRELVLARALSSTMINNQPSEKPEVSVENIEDITRDWFEKYE